MPAGKKILLIIGGGVAAYKSLLLIRELQRKGIRAECVLTRSGAEFVTPLSIGALSGNTVHQELFDLTAEAQMGHIELSRSADLIVVAPATADLMAKMTHGLADDLASTVLLATDTPVMIAPSMNVRMWEHPATQANLKTLTARGVISAGPDKGDMACGEYGYGRMAEPEIIAGAIEDYFICDPQKTITVPPCDHVPSGLQGKHILVTSGPTYEPIDPVRYIANRSSGKQGHAIAAALAGAGAKVTLVSGPTRLDAPAGCTVHAVETAEQMLQATLGALPADAVICAAAVADYRVGSVAEHKLKKDGGTDTRTLSLVENPDILHTVSQLSQDRPALVIGFAAETENLIEHAAAKRIRKGCDWILANDVSTGTQTFGGDRNQITLITGTGHEAWPEMTKGDIANRLARKLSGALNE